MLVGMTGGSGSGKSTVAALLSENGISVIDCDAFYHEMISTTSPCTEALVRRFGASVRNANGGIDTHVLAEIVFAVGAQDELCDLNRITHAHIKKALRDKLKDLEEKGKTIVVLDAPTLIEAGLHKECDLVVAVYAPPSVCLSRIIARDGLSTEDAARRIAAQKPRSFYEQHAEFIIDNEGNEVHLRKEVARLLSLLHERTG